jgi:hypothetical protein
MKRCSRAQTVYGKQDDLAIAIQLAMIGCQKLRVQTIKQARPHTVHTVPT